MTRRYISNDLLRRQRELRGWSQQKVADLLQEMGGAADSKLVGKWERGNVKPSPYYREKLCLLFDSTADKLGFIDPLEDPVRPLDLAGYDELFIPELTGAITMTDFSPSRRGFLEKAIAGASIASFSFNQLSSLTSIDDKLHHYASLLSLGWKYYYGGDAQSASHIVDGTLPSLTDTIRNATPASTHTSLLTILCRFYQLSGVAARDRMDIPRALTDGKKSIELAFSIDNAELIAASLFRRAKTYTKQQKYEKSFQDLEAALIYARRSRDPLNAYVQQATAELYAIIAPAHDQQMQQKSLTLLDNVENIRQRGNLADDGSFVKINTAGIALDRAKILTHFQRTQDAHQLLVVARQYLGSDLSRWQARLLIAHAEISLAEEDPAQCSEILTRAFPLIRQMNSRSNEARIHTLYQQLSTGYPHDTAVANLGEQLRSV